MTLYHTVQLVHEWHMNRLSAYEKKFINDIKEAVDGVGTNPNDNLVIQECGLSQRQVQLVKKIGKRFLIN